MFKDTLKGGGGEGRLERERERLGVLCSAYCDSAVVPNCRIGHSSLDRCVYCRAIERDLHAVAFWAKPPHARLLGGSLENHATALSVGKPEHRTKERVQRLTMQMLRE